MIRSSSAGSSFCLLERGEGLGSGVHPSGICRNRRLTISREKIRTGITSNAITIRLPLLVFLPFSVGGSTDRFIESWIIKIVRTGATPLRWISLCNPFELEVRDRWDTGTRILAILTWVTLRKLLDLGLEDQKFLKNDFTGLANILKSGYDILQVVLGVSNRTCVTCLDTKPITKFNMINGRWLSRQCRTCITRKRGKWKKASSKELRATAFKIRYYGMRLRVLKHYGDKCACCGENTEAFLCLDHINGGGNQHRKEFKSKVFSLYKWIENNNFPGGFQILCSNCNMAKHTKGVCPHQNQRLSLNEAHEIEMRRVEEMNSRIPKKKNS